MEKNKSNRITELPDSDYLSFLYSERDREEKLATYQGWNLWAIAIAMVTVICTLYGISCKHCTELRFKMMCFRIKTYLFGGKWGEIKISECAEK